MRFRVYEQRSKKWWTLDGRSEFIKESYVFNSKSVEDMHHAKVGFNRKICKVKIVI